MLLALLFALGVANFAVHKAVLSSDHPVLKTLPRLLRQRGGRLSLAFEFFVLLSAMLLTANGWSGTVWIYGLYSIFNGLVGWLVLDNRL